MKTLIIRENDKDIRTYQNIPVQKYSTVLSMLEYISRHYDDGLMYRHSCHHGSCGTCGMWINGERTLACLKHIKDIPENTIYLQALPGFPVVAQLVPDISGIFADFPEEIDYLRASETLGTPFRENENYKRLEDCIECGLCYSGCPVSQAFMGPAALAAYWRELEKHPEKKDGLLRQVAKPKGVSACQKHFICSRVCPTGVDPGKKIAQLQKALDSE